MDGDKGLSAPDLVLLRQVLLGEIDSNDEADVNFDDSINIKDLIRLKKYIAGQA